MISGDETAASVELNVSVLGVPFRIRLAGVASADAARIGRSWARCAMGPASGGSRRPVPVRARVGAPVTDPVGGAGEPGDGLDVAAPTLAALEESLTSRLTIAAIGHRRGELLMLHACGIADEAGRVLALVAASGTGKTTAAQVLGRRWAYVSDETVGVEPSGAVLPYPKPLSVKALAGRPKRQVGPDEAGLLPLPAAPLRLAGVLLLDRRPGTVVARVEEVEAVDAVADLVPQISFLSSRPRPLTGLLQTLEESGGVRRLVYAEAESLPSLVAALFADLDPAEGRPGRGHGEPAANRAGEPSAPVGGAASETSVGRDAPAAPPTGSTAPATRGTARSAAVLDAPRILRAPFDDAVRVADGDLLLLVAGTVLRLSGIGPAIWEAAADGADAAGLARELGDRLGPPPEGVSAEAAVRAAVEELIGVGALVATGAHLDPPPAASRA